jgi:hypothetical protein
MAASLAALTAADPVVRSGSVGDARKRPRQTVGMRDDAFAQATEGVLGLVPNEPCALGSGQQIVPRDFLRALAATAADWPHTPPEIWYGEIMQDCFWALARGRPTPPPGEDEQSTAEGLAFGALLAMMSMDRGGHHAAADLCQTALAYMATLPAWREVRIIGERDQPRHRRDQVRPEDRQTGGRSEHHPIDEAGPTRQRPTELGRSPEPTRALIGTTGRASWDHRDAM